VLFSKHRPEGSIPVVFETLPSYEILPCPRPLSWAKPEGAVFELCIATSIEGCRRYPGRLSRAEPRRALLPWKNQCLCYRYGIPLFRNRVSAIPPCGAFTIGRIGCLTIIPGFRVASRSFRCVLFPKEGGARYLRFALDGTLRPLSFSSASFPWSIPEGSLLRAFPLRLPLPRLRFPALPPLSCDSRTRRARYSSETSDPAIPPLRILAALPDLCFLRPAD